MTTPQQQQPAEGASPPSPAGVGKSCARSESGLGSKSPDAVGVWTVVILLVMYYLLVISLMYLASTGPLVLLVN
ncbi:hypothetical protein Pint_19515 [Pistacia integerrima]|uniref:Uncharacterized protein n=1 Tax=Pistacia integerrima TaxID=434235 RepID=A0ACC0YYM1_9ROSI|nr:hypothetical protein Pint_19515 [Pistacia integerrima]